MTKFRATFSDGTVLKRTSRDGQYTHAWRVIGQHASLPNPSNPITGFASSRELAEKALSATVAAYTKKATRGYFKNRPFTPGTIHFAEMVPVEVVS